MKVDFLIAGTQKGGTSALMAYLQEHPEICIACREEGHFFDRQKYFEHVPVDYSVYHQWFHPKGRERVVGEKTPIYMYWYDAPRRVWEYHPGMKWLLLLRNPIERAYSHWNMERARNWDDVDFWTALQNERVRSREALPLQHRCYSYVDRGFYTEQLRRIWFFFPRSQTLTLKSEELRDNPTTTLNKVCRFLGVDPYAHVDSQIVRSQAYAAPLGRREKAYLAHVFEYEIKELEQLLAWDCSDWLK